MDRHQRLSEIFLEAGKLAVDLRAAFLDDACGEDAALRSEIEAMLAAEAEAGPEGGTDAVKHALGAAAAEIAGGVHTGSFPHPARIGPYRILEKIGAGGMGVVYRAEQDEPVRREVALKILHAGLDTAAIISRFEVERQTLARMEHPGIAHLFDAGSAPDGRPYFAMERVQGLHITRYCRERGLGLRERVILFLQVCWAVRHAHRAGVVHRDLKPSNILVAEHGGSPTAKVIDFSIAKVIGDHTINEEFKTRTGQVVGTLEYMSPEQAEGRISDIDTRTDVYSLGTVLYELVAERLPYDLSGLPLHRAVNAISMEPPQPLRGTRTTATGRIDADLETIIGKCLEKPRRKRYRSAAELAEDIERYLDSRPIQARPPSTLYQMRKLVGRHRVAFGMVSMALVFLLLFSITVSVQLGIQRAARLDAEREVRKSRAINDFLQEMMAAADPRKEGGKVSLREVLDKAAVRADSGLEGQDEVRAELEMTFGLVYNGLGLVEESRQHYEKALNMLLNMKGGESEEVVQARLKLAGALGWLDRGDESLEQVEIALALSRKLHEGDHLQTAEALTRLADDLQGKGQYEEAIRIHEEALGMRRRLLGDDDPELKTNLLNIGLCLAQQGRIREGEDLLREALAIVEKALGRRHPDYFWALGELAYNLMQQGRIEESERAHKEALAGKIETLGPDHPSVANTQNNLAVLLLNQGRCAEAEAHAREATRVWTEQLGERTWSVGVTWNNLGFMRQCYGNYEGALPAYEKAREIQEQPAEGRGPKPNAFTIRNHGVLLGRMGRWREAESLIRRAGRIFEEEHGDENPHVKWTSYELGFLLLEQGKAEQAEPLLRESIGVPESDPGGAAAREVGKVLQRSALGRCLVELGAVDEGMALLSETREPLTTDRTILDDRRRELLALVKLFTRLRDLETAEVYRAAAERLDRLSSALPPS